MKLLLVVAGIPVGVAANWIYYRLSARFDKKQLASLNGRWIEIIVDSDRPVSITKFYYDNLKKSYIYEGKNYYRDGTPYCEFQSEALTYSLSDKKVYYVYKYWLIKKPFEQVYGSGVLEFKDRGSEYIFIRGHYRSMKQDSPPRAIHLHSERKICEKLEDEASERKDEEFVRAVASQYANGGSR